MGLGFWAGSAEDYADLVQIASPEIRSRCADCKVGISITNPASASDKWFEEYNYQVVIKKKYLSKELQSAIKKKPVVLEPWDPMGSLARLN